MAGGDVPAHRLGVEPLPGAERRWRGARRPSPQVAAVVRQGQGREAPLVGQVVQVGVDRCAWPSASACAEADAGAGVGGAATASGRGHAARAWSRCPTTSPRRSRTSVAMSGRKRAPSPLPMARTPERSPARMGIRAADCTRTPKSPNRSRALSASRGPHRQCRRSMKSRKAATRGSAVAPSAAPCVPGRDGKQLEGDALGVELAAQGLVQHRLDPRLVRGDDQGQGQGVQAAGEGLVVAGPGDDVREAAALVVELTAQDADLMLHQGDGRAAGVGDAQAGDQDPDGARRSPGRPSGRS